MKQRQGEASPNNFLGKGRFAELIGSSLHPCDRVVHSNPPFLHKKQSFPNADRREPEFIAVAGEFSRRAFAQTLRIQFAPNPDVRIE